MAHPRVYADFHNADSQGRVRLNCVGTIEDLAKLQIGLYAGLELTLYSEEVEADGKVEFSDQEKVWVAVIDWNAVHSTGATDGISIVVNH